LKPKDKARLLWKQQKKNIKDITCAWHNLIREKAKPAQRNAKKEELKQAKALLQSLKEEWDKFVIAEKKDKEIKQEQQAALQQYSEATTQRDKERALKIVKKSAQEYPKGSFFQFNLLPGYSLTQDLPKIYLGRYTGGAPCQKDRFGFMIEIKINKGHEFIIFTEQEAKYLDATNIILQDTNASKIIKIAMQEYFDQHKDFFGHVTVIFSTRNMGSHDTWGLSCTTDKKNVQGFAPRPKSQQTEDVLND